MSGPLYTRDILRLAAAIPNLVKFDEIPEGIEVRSPTCGSRVKIAVMLDEDGRVASFSQAVEACAFGQASAALMGAAAKGMDRADLAEAMKAIEAWLGGDNASVTGWPGLAVLEPARARRGRHGAILLPFRALLAAFEARP